MTADEYFAVASVAGWDRTELIEGFVYDMSPEHLLHARTVMALAQSLASQRPDLGVVASASVLLDELTVLQPDVVAYRPAGADDDAPLAAGVVEIVVEVAVSTTTRDTEVKPPLYAKAGIPDCWVVLPRDGVLRRSRDPARGGYRTTREHPFEIGDAAAAVGAVLAS